MRDLLANRDFLKLWTGETVSLVGSHVTEVALPLTAVLSLDASPGELGLLAAARFAPFLVVTLFAGVWADRSRRRPIMIGSNVGRALALSAVPVLAVADQLQVEHLYAIGFCVGTLTVLFDVSYVTVVPSLVARHELVPANGVMQASASVAEVGGLGLGGVLVGAFGAPIAVGVDAASYLVSATSLAAIRKDEPRPRRDTGKGTVLEEIEEGLGITFGDALLRPIAVSAAIYNFFEQSIFALLALFATRNLGLSPTAFGLLLSLGAVGALLGSMLATPLGRVVGVGPAYVGAMAVECAALLLLPLATLTPFPVPVVVAAFVVNGMGLGLTNVYAVTLRQTVTPAHLLGRMNASYRFLTYGAIPLGALLGGALAELLGVRDAIAIGGLGLLVALVVVLSSPLRGLVTIPDENPGEIEDHSG